MTGLLNARRERRVADAVIRDPEEHTVMDEHGAVRSIQAADVTVPADELERALERDAPRAPRAHVLEVPLARDARPDPRHLHRGRARRSCCCSARSCCCASRARVRGRARPRRRALAHQRRPARLPARARRRRLPGDRRPPLPGGGGGLGDRARRGRGRELLPGDRDLADGFVYSHTQSKIHVIVTHGFLRSLARLELEESAVGRFADQQRGVRQRAATARSPSATRRGAVSRRSPRRRPRASSRSSLWLTRDRTR